MDVASEADLAPNIVVPALAQTLAVDVAAIKHYAFQVVTRRRLGAATSASSSSSSSTHPRRLTTTAYTVSFEVAESLSQGGFVDAAAFETSVQSTMQTAVDSGTLASEIVVNGGSSVVVPTAQTITVAVVTQSPTMQPTPQPTKQPIPAPTPAPHTPTTPTIPTNPTPNTPTDTGGKGGKGNVNSASTSTIVLAVVFSFVGCLLCVGAGVVVVRRRKADFRNQFATDYKLESEQWDDTMTPFGGTRGSRAQTAKFDDYGAEMLERSSGVFGGDVVEQSSEANPLANFLTAAPPSSQDAGNGGTNV